MASARITSTARVIRPAFSTERAIPFEHCLTESRFLHLLLSTFHCLLFPTHAVYMVLLFQKLYRFINCVDLVSPHHAARELVNTIRQGHFTSLFQKSVKRVIVFLLLILI